MMILVNASFLTLEDSSLQTLLTASHLDVVVMVLINVHKLTVLADLFTKTTKSMHTSLKKLIIYTDSVGSFKNTLWSVANCFVHSQKIILIWKAS